MLKLRFAIKQMPSLLTLLLLLGLVTACTQENDTVDTGSEASAGSSESPGLPDGVTLLETVEATGDEIVIPYSKYQLDNGLTLIIHEDHSDPLVHVDITYHVGSAREEPKRSGFAHFFEHMMFQGSENVGDEEHFRIVTEAGGTMNGSTTNDRTNYYQTVPSNQLETVFWLESDRMGFFLDAVTQEKFEVQRETVKNERAQNYDNSAYGRWSEVNASALYPADHPYSWPVIGYQEDLNAATLDDLKNFFLRWYGPNNAALTVGGNVDVNEVLELAVKYFGEIPRGPEVVDDVREPVVLDSDRYVSYMDTNIRFPALFLTWPTVPLDHPDRVALEALHQIIGDGRKSFFYKEFILTQKAIEASGIIRNDELAGSSTFYLLAYPDTPLSQFEEEMRAVFNSFNADSISDEDLQIYKAQQEAGLINRMGSVSGKASWLANFETLMSNPNFIQDELEAIRSLTKDDVLRVFNTYIKDKPAVIQSIVTADEPEGQAQPDNYTPSERPVSLSSNGPEPESRDIDSSFDRSSKPTPGSNPLVTMPDYWRTELESGTQIIGTSESEVPMVNIRLTFDGGHLLEDPSLYGLASLTGAMMNEGTENYSAEAFEIELNKLGSNIGVGSGSDSFSVSMVSLERNLDATLALLEERLFHSVFTEEDLARLSQQQIENIEADKELPSAIASNVYSTLIYGAEHAFSVSSAGLPETLSQITLDDISAFRDQSLVSGSLDIVVVSNLSQEEVLDKLSFLDQLPDEAVTLREQPQPPAIENTTLYLVDKPDAPQSEIRIGYMTDLTYDATGVYFERALMNYVLGSAFNSRINLNLREDKGYTYGARSGFSGGRLPGPFTASAGVRTDTTADSIVQFMNEITGYRDNGITPEELKFTKDAIGQSEALDYETPGQKAGLLSRIVTYDLEQGYVSEQQQIISGLTIEQVNELAREHLPVESMYIVVVGDKAVIGESLEALGYPIVELDTEANPIN